ncbi:agmatinase [Candidatus Nomurabacteria bacterium RIFCSPHIGHO2_01_FULL_38_19]|uniref:Agmatinase n=1 Tax=Candidatus Nomurabacteria bacterium RIFCSPHIGHO2_01_FULL_38_19 TaxID=1801732 RepID=A0A1F6UTY3_9BACT|nr:MAG: agmatinase [Candidatus Nomurabacteria bacterium RIFCSPHIGHO2_01_FULL_38_19]
MKNTPNNFLGIPEISPEEAEVLVLPIPLEATVSYGRGTGKGPSAIIEASKHVELYDHELGYEVNEKIKIATLPTVVFPEQNAEKAQDVIAEVAEPWTNKFILSLGGEHSITPALVSAYQKKYSDLSILYFDAHTDMREEWGGTKWSHACAARRCQDNHNIKNIVWVGVRNTSLGEQQYINKEQVNYGNKYDLKKIISQLSPNVYISFDVDCFDVSTMPATGTPEPGGIGWYQVMEIFETVTREKNVVGADIAECAPIPGFHGYDFLVAKLAFKLIGYKFRK